MKKLILITTVGLIFLGVHVRLQAQGYATKPYTVLEWYAGAGTTHYFGDVGGHSGSQHGLLGILDGQDIDIEQTRIAGILGFRYILNKTFALNAQIKPMLLSGSDQNSVFGEAGRKYSFTTYLVDFSVVADVFIANRLTGAAPYFIIGVGAGLFNTKYFDQEDSYAWVNQFPAGESGSNKMRWTDLRSTGLFIAGFGVRLPPITKGISQDVEIRYHYASKDNLDGYTIGVSPKNNPQFGQIGDSFVVISYQLIFNLDKTFVYDHKGRISR